MKTPIFRFILFKQFEEEATTSLWQSTLSTLITEKVRQILEINRIKAKLPMRVLFIIKRDDKGNVRRIEGGRNKLRVSQKSRFRK